MDRAPIPFPFENLKAGCLVDRRSKELEDALIPFFKGVDEPDLSVYPSHSTEKFGTYVVG